MQKGTKRENKTREKLSFFSLAKINLAKISPLKDVRVLVNGTLEFSETAQTYRV